MLRGKHRRRAQWQRRKTWSNRLSFETLEPRRLLAAVNWDGGGDGSSWEDALNWSTDTVPTIRDDVTILANVNSVNINSSAVARSLNLSQRLQVLSGRSLQVDATSVVNASGQLQLVDMNLTGAGSLINRGTVESYGTTRFTIPFENNARLFISGGSLTLENGDVTNRGSLHLTKIGSTGECDAEIVVTSGKLINEATGTITATLGDRTCGARRIRAELDNRGLVTTADTILKIKADNAHHLNSGTMRALGSDIYFENSSSVIVTNTGIVDIGSGREVVGWTLEWVGTGTYTGSGKLRLNRGTLTLPTDLELSSITLAPENATTISGSGTLINRSRIVAGPGTTFINVPLVNQGSFIASIGNAELTQTFENRENALLRIGYTFRQGGNSIWGNVAMAHGFENFGTISLEHNWHGVTLNIAEGTLVNHGLIKTTGPGNSTSSREGISLRAELDNRGEIAVSSRLIIDKSGGSHVNSGVIRLESDGTDVAAPSRALQFKNAAVFENRSTIVISPGYTLATNTGLLQTAGSINVNGVLDPLTYTIDGGVLSGSGVVKSSVTSSGVVEPGDSVGKLRVEGNYAQSAAGSLRIEVTDAATHDRLEVTGSATLAGTLEVNVDASYLPEPGLVFDVLTHNTRSGEFDNFVGARVGPTRHLVLQSTDSKTSLVVERVFKTWDAEGDGSSWHDALNWNDDVLPTSAEDVLIDWGDNSGTIVLSQGNVSVRSLDSSAPLAVSGGQLMLTEDSVIKAPLTLTGDGELTGTGQLTIEELFTWTGGAMSGGGTTLAAGGFLIEGDALKLLVDTRRLVNAGQAVVSGLGEVFRGLSAPEVHNLAGATIHLQTDADFLAGPEPGGKLINHGRLIKDGGRGTATVEVDVQNLGEVVAEQGTLRFKYGYEQPVGSTTMSGGHLEFGHTALIQGGVLQGAGRLTGDVVNSGHLMPGSELGELTISGDYTQTETGQLTIELAGAALTNDRVSITGQAQLDGILTIAANSDIQADVGDQFPIMGFGNLSGSFLRTSGLDIGGGRELVSTVDSSQMILTVHAGDDRPVSTSQTLADGFQWLTGALSGWASAFDLGDYDFSDRQLPEVTLPVAPAQLNAALSLADRLAAVELPEVAVASSWSSLKTQLGELGLVVECISGDLPGAVACIGDKLVQVRLMETIHGISATANYPTGAGNELEGLATTSLLSGQIDTTASLEIGLVVGVDSNGFYVHRDSQLKLGLEANGQLQGTATIGGLTDLAVSGAASTMLDVIVSPAVEETRYYPSDLGADPRAYLVPAVEGSADVDLSAQVGPISIAAATHSELNFDDRQRTSHAVFPSVGATLALPDLTQDVEGLQTPAVLQLAGVREAENWRLTADSPDVYQLGQIQIDQVDLSVALGPDTLSGSGHARLAVDRGVVNQPVTLELDGSLDASTWMLSGQVNLGSLALGSQPTLVQLQQPTASGSLSLEFGEVNQSTVQVELQADSAALLPGSSSTWVWTDDDASDNVPGVSIRIASDGLFHAKARRMSASLGQLINVDVISAGDTWAAELSYLPGAPADSTLLSLQNVAASLPVLERAGLTPTLVLDQVQIKQNGQVIVGSATAQMPADYPDAFGIGGIIPAAIHDVTLGFNDPNDLTDVTIEIGAEITIDDPSRDYSLPFTPVLTINGQPDLTDLRLTLHTESFSDGLLRPINLGPITLAMDDWMIGGSVVDAELQIGRLGPNGQPQNLPGLQEPITGTVKIATSDLFPTDLEITLAGDLNADSSGMANLGLHGVAQYSESGASARFHVDLQGQATDLGPGFFQLNVQPQLDSVTFENVGPFDIGVMVVTVGAVEFYDVPTAGAVADLLDVHIDFPGIPGWDGIYIERITGYNDDPDDGLPIDGFRIDGSLALPNSIKNGVSAEASTILATENGVLSFTNFAYRNGDVEINSEIGFTADRAELFPDFPAFTAIIDRVDPNAATPALQGTVDLGTGLLNVTADRVGVKFPSGLRAEGTSVQVSPGATDIFSTNAILKIPFGDDSTVELIANNWVLDATGGMTVQSAVISASNGLIEQTLGVAQLLPFDVTSLEISTPDGAATVELSAFDLTVTGTFNFDLFGELPVDPIVRIGSQVDLFDGQRIEISSKDGEQQISAADTYTTTVRVQDNTAKLQDLGPIVLGLSGMNFGPMTVDAAVLLGGYQDGLFQPQFGTVLDTHWVTENETADTQEQFGTHFQAVGEITRDVDSGSTTLDLLVGAAITYQDPAAFVEFTNMGVDLNIVLQVDSNFQVLPPQISLDSATVEEIAIHFGPFMTMEATNATIDFTAATGEPFLTFQGDALRKEGELSLVFSNPALGNDNPLAGLGGAAGNFGIGFEDGALRFYQLPEFFVDVTIPENFRFGLPEWLPFSVRKVGVRFHQQVDPVGDILYPVIADLTDISLRFSGGLVGNDLWPITGQVENMEVDLQKLSSCGELLVDQAGQGHVALDGMLGAGLDLFQQCEFPITNLDLAEFAIEPFELGPITIGGGLGLGLINVDSDEDGIEEKVMYGRILGQFGYNDIGAGVELIVTEYGPVLSRIFAGVPIPIGALVGGLIGSAVFPAIGSATGASIGDRTGFILTGFEGGLVFDGEPLPEILDPLDILNQPAIHDPLNITLENTTTAVEAAKKDGGYTWDNGFTFAGSATLTNIYVNGLISGKLTLGANIGYGDDVGLQLFGIGDLNVFGMPLTSAGILFDFSDPLVPALNMAIALPGTKTNPLALVLPARGEFGIRVDTTGVAQGAIVGIHTLLSEIRTGIEEVGRETLDKVVEELAVRMEAERSAFVVLTESERERASRLLQIVLDTNTNEDVDDDEWETPLDRNEILDRLLARLDPDAGAVLIATANVADAIFETLLVVGAHVVRGAGQGVAAIQDDGFLKMLDLSTNVVFNTVGLAAEWPKLVERQQSIGGFEEFGPWVNELVATIAKRSANALRNSTDEARDIINPSLTVQGALQPVIAGIPFGEPTNEVAMRLDKQGLEFSLDTTVGTLFNLVSAIGTVIGAPDVPLGVTVSLPIGEQLLDGLLWGNDLEPLDPFSPDWAVELRTGFRIANFEAVRGKGLLIPPDATDDFLKRFVQLLGEDDPLDPERIPIQNPDHYADLQRGGLLFNGLVQIPRLIADPVALFTDPHLNLEPPESLLEYPTWLDDVVSHLTVIDTPAIFQAFHPSFSDVMQVDFGKIPCPNFPEIPSCQDDPDRWHIDDQAAEFNQIVSEAYVEGTWDGKLLSMPISKGKIDIKSDHMVVEVQDSLLGIAVEFGLGSREVEVSGPKGPVTIDFPIASAGLDIGPTVVDHLLGELGIPTIVKASGNNGFSFRAYSPGFSGDTTERDTLKRTGGFEVSASLDILNLLQDAQLDIQYVPATNPDVRPVFTARGSVGSLVLPDLLDVSTEVISFDNLEIVMSNDHPDGDVLLGLTGSVNLLNGRIASTLGTAWLKLTDQGVVGEIALMDDRQLLGGGFDIEADFFMHINTTGSAQMAQRFGTDQLVTIESGFSIHADGELNIADLTNIVDARFDFQLAPDQLNVGVKGDLNLGVLGELKIDDTLHIPVGAPKIFGEFSTGQQAFAGPGYAVGGSRYVRIDSSTPEVVLEINDATLVLDPPGLPPFTLVDADLKLEFTGENQFTLANVPGDLMEYAGFDAVDGFPTLPFDVEIGSDGRIDVRADWNASLELFGYEVSGDGDLVISRKAGEQSVTASGSFSASLSNVLRVAATLDAFGCLRTHGTIFDIKGDPVWSGRQDISLKNDACGPQLFVNDITFDEGDVDKIIQAQVGLTETSSNAVTVKYSVTTGSGHLGTGHEAWMDDFAIEKGTLTIPAGHTLGSIPITIRGDEEMERDEVFRVQLTSATNANVGDPWALMTIENNDVEPPTWRPGTLLYYGFDDGQNAFTAEPTYTFRSEGNVLTNVGQSLVVAEGIPGVDPGSISNAVLYEDGVFEFTLDPIGNLVLGSVELLDRPLLGGIASQQWQVTWSEDNYSQPFAFEPLFTYDRNFLDLAGAPDELLDDLIGWRFNRAELPPSLSRFNNLCTDHPVTFRVEGLDPGQFRIDNLAVRGGFLLEGNCNIELTELAGETLQWLDSLVGVVSVDVRGGGFAEAKLIPKFDSGDIDPTPFMQLDTLSLVDTDPATTTVVVSIENPAGLASGELFDFGQINSDTGVFQLDLASIPLVFGSIDISGALNRLLLAGLADGAEIRVGGDPGDTLNILVEGVVGELGGKQGVDLSSAGKVNVTADAWYGGNWQVGSLGDVNILYGDLSPSIETFGGVDSIIVQGGNLTSPRITTGKGAATGDGTSGVIRVSEDARGKGGAILVGVIAIDGDLGLLESKGGAIQTRLEASKVGAISATSSLKGSATGDIFGVVDVASLDMLESIGGVISASIHTSDASHDSLQVLAQPDTLGRGGVIDSRNSFHVAGGVQRIEAGQLFLRLVAGGVVGEVSVLPNANTTGVAEGSLTALDFESVDLKAQQVALGLYTTHGPSSATPPTNRFAVLNHDGIVDADVHLAHPGNLTLLSFQAAGAQVTEPPQQFGLREAEVLENRDGAPVASLGDIRLDSSDPRVNVSDVRFELVEGLLKLKGGERLQLDEVQPIQVDVTAEFGDEGKFTELFLISIVENPYAWHNSADPLDVNNDGLIAPLDALLVINHINLFDIAPPALNLPFPPYPDVDRNDWITPSDALLVIDYLNLQIVIEGEAEGQSGDYRPLRSLLSESDDTVFDDSLLSSLSQDFGNILDEKDVVSFAVSQRADFSLAFTSQPRRLEAFFPPKATEEDVNSTSEIGPTDPYRNARSIKERSVGHCLPQFSRSSEDPLLGDLEAEDLCDSLEIESTLTDIADDVSTVWLERL